VHKKNCEKKFQEAERIETKSVRIPELVGKSYFVLVKRNEISAIIFKHLFLSCLPKERILSFCRQVILFLR
jgi:hypothetical protein